MGEPQRRTIPFMQQGYDLIRIDDLSRCVRAFIGDLEVGRFGPVTKRYATTTPDGKVWQSDRCDGEWEEVSKCVESGS